MQTVGGSSMSSSAFTRRSVSNDNRNCQKMNSFVSQMNAVICPKDAHRMLNSEDTDQIGLDLHCMFSPRGYKTFFMLNSTEHEIFPAHKC